MVALVVKGGDQLIAHELVDVPAVVLHDVGLLAQIGVEHGDDLLGLDLFGVGGKAADIRKEQGADLALTAQLHPLLAEAHRVQGLPGNEFGQLEALPQTIGHIIDLLGQPAQLVPGTDPGAGLEVAAADLAGRTPDGGDGLDDEAVHEETQDDPDQEQGAQADQHGEAFVVFDFLVDRCHGAGNRHDGAHLPAVFHDGVVRTALLGRGGDRPGSAARY